VHISLSSLLKRPSKPLEVSSSAGSGMGMFSADDMAQEAEPVKTESFESGGEKENNDNVINDLFG